MYICMYVRMYVCICMYVYTCTYLYMYVCIYVCIYIYMYACMYVCTGNHSLLRSVMLSTGSHLISCLIDFGGSLRCGKTTGGLRITMKLHLNGDVETEWNCTISPLRRRNGSG